MLKTKSEIRSYVRTLPCPTEQEASLVMSAVEGLEVFKSAHSILLYWSIGNELPTQEMIKLWSSSKQIVLPKVQGEELSLFAYRGEECLVKGSFGIMEPSGEAEQILPEIIDLAIIPGVAFDEHCHRLGHGKGYYDRLLPKLNCPIIGIAQQAQIVGNVPVESHDKSADIVITPLNCYFCKL